MTGHKDGDQQRTQGDGGSRGRPQDNRPIIALTMGDPAGVGPEICLAALASPQVTSVATPVVFGDFEVLARCATQLCRPFDADRLTVHDSLAGVTTPSVLHIPSVDTATLTPGIVTPDTGAASFAYIDAAIRAVLQQQVAAVTTAPISKEALAAASIAFPGHTEIFAERCGVSNFCMMQYAPEITCTFVTVHVGYAEVPSLLSVQRIVDVIRLTTVAVCRLDQVERPTLVVCGLNPHAGEHGLFGNGEEEQFIIPAMEQCRREGLNAELVGPLPPDTAFLPWRRQSTDAFICMYHDQGHIPVKALAFESAVNTTLGLPVVRTSVDHGTACDIAWQGRAMPDSLFAALHVAARLSTTG
jgi:4-hydroxythreonine-4-phosphate dehydrogenase